MYPGLANHYPLEHGRLRIQDLKIATYALRLRLLWLQRTVEGRPWRDLDLAFGSDQVVAAMSKNSIYINLGMAI